MKKNKKKPRWTLATTGIVAALTGLAFLGTLIIRIPIPATTGYFNLGDVFVILAALWLGPLIGFIVGALGPTLADAIGFPQFIPATFIVKGIMGFSVGLIGGGTKDLSIKRRYIAVFVGAIILVGGYFVFEAFIYPYIGKSIPLFSVTTMGAAIVEIFPNSIQAIIGAIGGLALWKTVSGVSSHLSS